MIERDIPGVGSQTREELAAVSKKSCDALKTVGLESVQWQQSYIAGDKWVAGRRGG